MVHYSIEDVNDMVDTIYDVVLLERTLRKIDFMLYKERAFPQFVGCLDADERDLLQFAHVSRDLYVEALEDACKRYAMLPEEVRDSRLDCIDLEAIAMHYDLDI